MSFWQNFIQKSEVDMGGVNFTVYKKDGYYESEFLVNTSDEELLPAYKSFYLSDDWTPELNELVDISDLVNHDLGAPGLFNLANYIGSIWEKNKIKPKLAIFIPIHSNMNASFLFYIYSQFFEGARIFRDKIKAISWLVEK